MADIPNDKIIGAGVEATTHHNMDGNFASKANENTQASDKMSEAISNTKNEINQLDEQIRNLTSDLEKNKNALLDFANNVNNSILNSKKGFSLSKVSSEYPYSSYRDIENAITFSGNSNVKNLYDKFTDDLGEVLKNTIKNKHKVYNEFNPDVTDNYAHLFASYDQLRRAGYGNDDKLIREWVNFYSGSQIKGNITDKQLLNAQKGYDTFINGYPLGNLISSYIDSYLQVIPKAENKLNTGKGNVGITNEDVENTSLIKSLNEQLVQLVSQRAEKESTLKTLQEQQRQAEESALQQQNNLNQAKQTELNTEKQITQEQQKQIEMPRMASFVNNIGMMKQNWQEIGYSTHNFFMSMRNLAATIYSVRNLGRVLQTGMGATERLTAQRYRFERYDTTGIGGDAIINMAYKEAQRSRGEMDSSATLAQRILATGVTNGRADEAIRLAGLIDRASFLGGSTAQEARMAKLQLSQGLASNQLGGDELRSIRENALGLTEMISKGLTRAYEQGILTDPDFANVGIGDLKILGKKAKLTAKVVTTAIGLMEDEINEGFSKIPEQFSQTLDKLTNTWNKIMYELNKSGKGLGRITQLVQDFQAWLDTDKGKEAIARLTEIVDKFIDMITTFTKWIGNIVNVASPAMNALLPILKWIIPLKLASNTLFGSSYWNWSRGALDFRSGILSAGGISSILYNLSTGEERPFDLALSSDGKIHTSLLRSLATSTIGTLFGHNMYTTGKDESGNMVLQTVKVGGLLGKMSPVLAKGVGSLGAIAGPLAIIAAAYNHFNKKAEGEYESRELGKFFDYSGLGLTDDQASTLDKMKKDFIKNNTNYWGYGARATYTSDAWADANMEIKAKAYEYKDQNILKQMLNTEKEIAENTGETLEVTDDFLRGIRDMRTRSFRGELLMNNTRNNNSVVVNLSYTGNVEDFESRVIEVINGPVKREFEKVLV